MLLRNPDGVSVFTVDILTGAGMFLMDTLIIMIIIMIRSIIHFTHLIITTDIIAPIITILIGGVITKGITVITIRDIHTITGVMLRTGMYITEPEVQDHQIHIAPTVQGRRTRVQEV
jgi:ABC-type polysaccharide/polyol phosphate export permease